MGTTDVHGADGLEDICGGGFFLYHVGGGSFFYEGDILNFFGDGRGRGDSQIGVGLKGHKAGRKGTILKRGSFALC